MRETGKTLSLFGALPALPSVVPPFNFHPAVQRWLDATFAAPTAAQAEAWPHIQAGRNVLISAPTGSGKTLAAFLAALDDLVQRGLDDPLPDETAVVYVSPLKALSNDIQRNLELPLAGIRAELEKLGLPDVAIRTSVRTGDTSPAAREQMRRRPPHVLVTTPESLYILLGAESGRKMLASARTVIVDEIHAVAQTKRGAHLALTIERLEALIAAHDGAPLVRIGLSATQKPVETVAQLLVGVERECSVIDIGHVRERDLAIELPPLPLTAVMSAEAWEQIHARIAELALRHRTTLVFVNTRRMVERLARHLSERLGSDQVAAHHGSLSKEKRFDAEQRLKAGQLKVLVATASLELGIDIGDVDLVCQLSSPRAIATFLQRVGRSGHSLAGVPKGRLFPASRDDLIECAALLDSVQRGELDRLTLPDKPLDVLAQQIVAEVACGEWQEDALFACMTRAQPYRALPREEFSQVVRMLADGYSTRRGWRSSYLHRDAVNRRLRARRGARLTAVTSGGTIPDNADCDVVLEPAAQFVGTVNEDFAIESLAGDIFQLGNQSYRILRVERGKVRVEDARGAPPNIPFWFGEAPGRTGELSSAVARLRQRVSDELKRGEQGREGLSAWLERQVGLSASAAEQIVDYLEAGERGLGAMPTQARVVMERFFDESGGTQLVIHAPFGSRINRAWGLALRKRFCRQFNFELQAAATEDCIVLSLSHSHSFPLDEVSRYLRAATVREVLVQALLDAPMFATRWRWNASVAMALQRFRAGKKVPPQLQRIEAEDLLASVFPDQLACAENLTGELEIPDHPLVRQTIRDCLYEAMDLSGLQRILNAMESGELEVVARDLTEASPFAQEVLNARPYAFLDDAPLEERRTQMVMNRRWGDPETAQDLGKLDAQAIERVREEAWPRADNADEMHDALLALSFVTVAEASRESGWLAMLSSLAESRRACLFRIAVDESWPAIWIAAERLPEFAVLFSGAHWQPCISAPDEFAAKEWRREVALVEIVRGRLQGLGPVTVTAIAQSLGVAASEINVALHALQSEGFAMQGKFTPDAAEIEWCERRLLARVHRYTINRLRAEVEPVEARDFMRFLFKWQHVAPDDRVRGADALTAIIAQLEGFEAAAGAWEAEILPARMADYDFTWLDNLCLVGRVLWTRLSVPKATGKTSAYSAPVRATPIALVMRRNAAHWDALAQTIDLAAASLSSRAQSVAEVLRAHGAAFFHDIVQTTGLLATQVEQALAELTAAGAVSADGFSGLRALLMPSGKRAPLASSRRRRRTPMFGMEDAGRWSLRSTLQAAQAPALPDTKKSARDAQAPSIEHVARTLLKRYGVVCWRLLEREAEWLPPWRDLVRCYRRLEARGEIRGGRFVAGITSEQFALPEAIGALREVRRQALGKTWVVVSGADPLNLVGVLLPGAKVAALTANRVLYRDGVPIAALQAGQVQYFAELEPQEQWQARNALVKRPVASPLAAYLR